MRTHMYTHNIYTDIHTHWYFTCTCTHIYIHTHAHTYALTPIIYTYIYISGCVFCITSFYIPESSPTRFLLSAYRHTHTWARTHMHTHIYRIRIHYILLSLYLILHSYVFQNYISQIKLWQCLIHTMNSCSQKMRPFRNFQYVKMSTQFQPLKHLFKRIWNVILYMLESSKLTENLW